MPRPKFAKGNPGRPTGSKNKFSSFKDACFQVFEDIGGTEAFADWAKLEANQTEFYKLMAKMLPKTIEGAGENGAIVIRINNAAKRPNGESGN